MTVVTPSELHPRPGFPAPALPLEFASRRELQAQQVQRLATLVSLAWASSRFYRRKWEAAGIGEEPAIRTLEDLYRLPITRRQELVEAQGESPPDGGLATTPSESLMVVNETAGTTGRRLLWYDSAESWRWVRSGWDYVLGAVGARPGERGFFAFSFGPVLWYWAGFEQAQQWGLLALTGGAMTPQQRVENIYSLGAGLLVTTAEHALELAHAATEAGYHPARSPLRAVLYAAAPGMAPSEAGRQLEAAWGAEPFCVTWQTETGITGFECREHPGGVHLIESEIVFEVLAPDSDTSVAPGEVGELVVTPLGRTAMPVFRYRTGDLVRVRPEACRCGSTFRLLDGGILGRVSDRG